MKCLIEEWLGKLDHEFPIAKMTIINVFDNRWRVSLYRNKREGQFVPEMVIFQSYFLHVVDDEIKDRTLKG